MLTDFTTQDFCHLFSKLKQEFRCLFKGECDITFQKKEKEITHCFVCFFISTKFTKMGEGGVLITYIQRVIIFKY